MSSEIAVSGRLEIRPGEPEASGDDQLIALWLHGRSPHTQRAYLADVERFRDRERKALASVTLADLQDFAMSLEELSPARPLPGALGREVAAGLRTSDRLFALRCRPC